MRVAWLLAGMVLGCGGAEDSIEGDVQPVREAVSALTKAKVETGAEVTKLDVAIVNLGQSSRFGLISDS